MSYDWDSSRREKSCLYSSVAQWQSIRLLTGGLLVRVQPEEPAFAHASRELRLGRPSADRPREHTTGGGCLAEAAKLRRRTTSGAEFALSKRLAQRRSCVLWNGIRGFVPKCRRSDCCVTRLITPHCEATPSSVPQSATAIGASLSSVTKSLACIRLRAPL